MSTTTSGASFRAFCSDTSAWPGSPGCPHLYVEEPVVYINGILADTWVEAASIRDPDEVVVVSGYVHASEGDKFICALEDHYLHWQARHEAVQVVVSVPASRLSDFSAYAGEMGCIVQAG